MVWELLSVLILNPQVMEMNWLIYIYVAAAVRTTPFPERDQHCYKLLDHLHPWAESQAVQMLIERLPPLLAY